MVETGHHPESTAESDVRARFTIERSSLEAASRWATVLMAAPWVVAAAVNPYLNNWTHLPTPLFRVVVAALVAGFFGGSVYVVASRIRDPTGPDLSLAAVTITLMGFVGLVTSQLAARFLGIDPDRPVGLVLSVSVAALVMLAGYIALAVTYNALHYAGWWDRLGEFLYFVERALWRLVAGAVLAAVAVLSEREATGRSISDEQWFWISVVGAVCFLTVSGLVKPIRRAKTVDRAVRRLWLHPLSLGPIQRAPFDLPSFAGSLVLEVLARKVASFVTWVCLLSPLIVYARPIRPFASLWLLLVGASVLSPRQYWATRKRDLPQRGPAESPWLFRRWFAGAPLVAAFLGAILPALALFAVPRMGGVLGPAIWILPGCLLGVLKLPAVLHHLRTVTLRHQLRSLFEETAPHRHARLGGSKPDALGPTDLEVVEKRILNRHGLESTRPWWPNHNLALVDPSDSEAVLSRPNGLKGRSLDEGLRLLLAELVSFGLVDLPDAIKLLANSWSNECPAVLDDIVAGRQGDGFVEAISGLCLAVHNPERAADLLAQTPTASHAQSLRIRAVMAYTSEPTVSARYLDEAWPGHFTKGALRQTGSPLWQRARTDTGDGLGRFLRSLMLGPRSRPSASDRLRLFEATTDKEASRVALSNSLPWLYLLARATQGPTPDAANRIAMVLADHAYSVDHPVHIEQPRVIAQTGLAMLEPTSERVRRTFQRNASGLLDSQSRDGSLTVTVQDLLKSKALASPAQDQVALLMTTWSSKKERSSLFTDLIYAARAGPASALHLAVVLAPNRAVQELAIMQMQVVQPLVAADLAIRFSRLFPQRIALWATLVAVVDPGRALEMIERFLEGVNPPSGQPEFLRRWQADSVRPFVEAALEAYRLPASPSADDVERYEDGLRRLMADPREDVADSACSKLVEHTWQPVSPCDQRRPTIGHHNRHYFNQQAISRWIRRRDVRRFAC